MGFVKPAVVFTALIMVFTGCGISKKRIKLEPENYLKWYGSAENVHTASDTVGELVYNLRLFPKEVNIALCAMKQCEPKDVLVASLEERTTITSFLFEIRGVNTQKDFFSIAGVSGISKNDRVMYLTSGIKEDLKGLSAHGDTLNCVSVMYEPTIKGQAKLVIDIDNPKQYVIREVIYSDRVISGSRISLKMPVSSNSNIPTLNLKKYE